MGAKRPKSLVTNKNQDLKKLCCMVKAGLLPGGGSVCLANLGGSCLHRGGSRIPGVPSLAKGSIIFFSVQWDLTNRDRFISLYLLISFIFKFSSSEPKYFFALLLDFLIFSDISASVSPELLEKYKLKANDAILTEDEAIFKDLVDNHEVCKKNCFS